MPAVSKDGRSPAREGDWQTWPVSACGSRCKRSRTGACVVVVIALFATSFGECTALEISVETEKDCQLTTVKDTSPEAETCFSGWSVNASYTHCCSVITASSSIVHSSLNETYCCEDTCPDGTNHTLNSVFSCHYQLPRGRNVTVSCCQTQCCGRLLEEHEPTNEEGEVRISEAWLIILCTTVALSGAISIVFTLYMCVKHDMLNVSEALQSWHANKHARRTLLKEDSSHKVVMRQNPSVQITSMFVNSNAAPHNSTPTEQGGLLAEMTDKHSYNTANVQK